MLRLLARWLPHQALVVVADHSFSALAFLDLVRDWVAVITRLRLDAALYEPAPSADRAAKASAYPPFKPAWTIRLRSGKR